MNANLKNGPFTCWGIPLMVERWVCKNNWECGLKNSFAAYLQNKDKKKRAPALRVNMQLDSVLSTDCFYRHSWFST